ncbi:PREDICTED: protein ripply1 [Condylura cristata]|uniref:protein ripply1 n=1 Tax=Condylura cristata TaxID=143302 RepID=UPI00033467CF|nr:PREDICTED: protein ripply1 [Condylura cristata]
MEAAATAPGSAQAPLALRGLLSPSPLPAPGQEVHGNERKSTLNSLPPPLISPLSPREAYLWRPWMSSTNDRVKQAIGGATRAEVTKADCEFHHPVRLFWPKSRSFDYLYRDGEILLQNFPVQATINLYEDSESEEVEEEEKEQRGEQEQKEEEENEEADEKGPAECVRVPGSARHRAAVYLPSPHMPCPN